MADMDFTGVIAYPITPFTSDGQVNIGELRRLIAALAVSGVDSITVLGSSGSFAYLDARESAGVVRAAVDEAAAVNPALPVYAGISAVGTREVLDAAAEAQGAGARGLVLSAVSYVPLNSDEVATLVHTVASANELPICLYNNPGTTQFDFPIELVAELAALPNVAALKDPGSGREEFEARGRALRNAVGGGFAHGMSGDAAIVDHAIAADAWHSGAAALLPEHYVRLRRALVDGDDAQFIACRQVLSTIIHTMAGQRGLSNLHSLARACGWDAGDPRRPLLPVSGSQQRELARLIDLLD